MTERTYKKDLDVINVVRTHREYPRSKIVRIEMYVENFFYSFQVVTYISSVRITKKSLL